MKKKAKLNAHERNVIYRSKENGHSIRMISKILHRAASTISRELRRNVTERSNSPGVDSYLRARYADEEAKKRRSKSRKRERLKNQEIRDYVKSKLYAGWSPELIAGRIKKDCNLSISYEAIYQWIYEKERFLMPLLLIVGKRGQRKRSSNKRYRSKKKAAAKKRSIEERPEIVDLNIEFGNWEADTVVSKQSKECIHTLRERTSRFTIFTKLSDCSSASAYETVKEILGKVPSEYRKTLTQDNGSENFFHDKIEKDFKSLRVFFCHAYCSWERGSVENANKQLRKSFPKKTDFKNVTQEEIRKAQNHVNHRPMKCLKYKTPFEVFTEKLGESIVANL